ncbi:hypothetical protein LEP1GSC188_4805 [Leptospira weilii serovar Topaz str. LT2116]|uniref:Uncharacterized protein n=1 Tax=Leptospira weilii serovar Topaz str. LT2116 TaxID=1088540 RepID=M3EMX7_9LEPT|nr:hypothetical protein LEP1GSC188_4805 [Leptospira weilii serovar Topaz str. LT2116]
MRSNWRYPILQGSVINETLNTTLRIAQIRSGPFCLTRDFFDENKPCTVKSIRDIQKGKDSNLLKNELFLNI